MPSSMRTCPVILDTDIGGDIDDTWALAMVLQHPHIRPILVSTDTGDTTYRARICARFLEQVGRSEIPIAVGIPETRELPRRQTGWIEGYALESYPGRVHSDGVRAVIEAIRTSSTPVTLVCIGPVPTIASALERAPDITRNAHFVGMHGSIHSQLQGKEGAIAECNVVRNPGACRAVFEAPWLSKTITPLDTCARVRLDGNLYARVRDAGNAVTEALMENYRCWACENDYFKGDPCKHSSWLYDTVAVHLAVSRDFLTMERMGIRVTPDGFTRPDDDGPILDVALSWTDLPGFQRHLVEILTGRLRQAGTDVR